MIGIYKITSPTKKVYIGQSVNIERRFSTYKRNNPINKQPRLYGSFKKYGIENHKFEVIEECDISELNNRERYWQDYFNVLEIGLNCCLTNTNNLDYIISTETRKKISIKATGRKHTLQTKNKLSIAHSGKKLSEEHRLKLVSKLTGRKGHSKKATEETKKLCSKNATKHLSKIVLCLNNGIFYESAKEVSDIFKIKHSTLRGWLNGSAINKTSFIYV